jgi:hypothetical protein
MWQENRVAHRLLSEQTAFARIENVITYHTSLSLHKKSATLECSQHQGEKYYSSSAPMNGLSSILHCMGDQRAIEVTTSLFLFTIDAHYLYAGALCKFTMPPRL